MSGHGGGGAMPISLENGEMETSAPIDAKTFRHFIREPRPEERFRASAASSPSADPNAINAMLERLAKRLVFESIWEDALDGATEAWENPDIPAGYTYLAQIVAHDLVQSSVTMPNLGAGRAVLRNNRSFRLDLDTLYGAGPASCPHAYVAAEKFGARTRLRLTRMRQSRMEIPSASPPYRDIGRGVVVTGNGFQWKAEPGDRDIGRAVSEDDNGFQWHHPTEPLIADPRNDDNAIVSQVATIFIWLHNTVIGELEDGPPLLPGRPTEVVEEYRFNEARRIVTGVYRRVVRNDLLPRLVDARVLRHYENGADPYVDDMADDRVPIEFSHAAYRFGHAMVRPSYHLNGLHSPFGIDQVLRTTSRREPYSMPLNENWIIQWSRFFDLGTASEGILNHSRRIGPSHAGSLEVPAGFGFAEDGAPKTLGHRDLLRGYSTRFWSVAALIEEIRRRQPDLVALSPLLSDFERTRGLIEAWLRRHRGTGKAALSDEEIMALRDDPPLVFFILFEAATQADGRHLGVLGSIIVAETLLREFLPAEPAADTRRTGATSSFDDVDSMPTLLKRLARRAGLESAFPPFL